MRPESIEFLEQAGALPPDRLTEVGSLFATAVGATSALILIADYAHRMLRPLGSPAGVEDGITIDGTIAGRVFLTGTTIESPHEPTTVTVSLVEGSERIGVVEMHFAVVTERERTLIWQVVPLLVLMLVSKRRYTDLVVRARRAKPLSTAAEMQWDLLPPLACTTPRVAIGGSLEPAYSTGGDSFDYALNPNRLEFVVIDAVGHGMPAILKSMAAINTARNVRREGGDLTSAYHRIDRVMADQFGESFYVTGILAELDIDSGELTWINAGHPLPLLVRDGHLVGELSCLPSMPIGLGGSVREVKHDVLQRGDRVLFYTDGVTEGRAKGGSPFGVERLGDLFVRASLDQLSTVETARRLAVSIVEYSNDVLRDDATIVVDWFG